MHLSDSAQPSIELEWAICISLKNQPTATFTPEASSIGDIPTQYRIDFFVRRKYEWSSCISRLMLSPREKRIPCASNTTGIKAPHGWGHASFSQDSTAVPQEINVPGWQGTLASKQ